MAGTHPAVLCPLCASTGGALVWQDAELRVIRADEAGFPAFYRVVWHAHVAEFSDLSAPQRQRCIDVVVLVEQQLRLALQPTKINLAALGNQVPHLHWHVIARFDWDSHYPAPVWATPGSLRPVSAQRLQAVTERLPELERCIARQLGGLP